MMCQTLNNLYFLRVNNNDSFLEYILVPGILYVLLCNSFISTVKKIDWVGTRLILDVGKLKPNDIKLLDYVNGGSMTWA